MSNVTLTFTELIILAVAPALVGGLVGVGSGVIAPWLLHSQKEESEKKKKRAEKFEELVAALYEYDHWLDMRRNEKCFGAEEKLSISPLTKAETIAATYFPAFSQSLVLLKVPAGQYELWMSKAALKRLEGKISEINDGFDGVFNPYRTKLEAVLDELKEYAKNNFQ